MLQIYRHSKGRLQRQDKIQRRPEPYRLCACCTSIRPSGYFYQYMESSFEYHHPQQYYQVLCCADTLYIVTVTDTTDTEHSLLYLVSVTALLLLVLLLSVPTVGYFSTVKPTNQNNQLLKTWLKPGQSDQKTRYLAGATVSTAKAPGVRVW